MAPQRDGRSPGGRPDAGPMRFALAVSGLVAATAMATSIVRPPAPPSVELLPAATPTVTPVPAAIVVRHVTQYVQLQPGESPPPGASVVEKPAASPRVVIVTITAPPAPPAQPAPVRRVVVVTRQSGATK